jgi:hypothetical protein
MIWTTNMVISRQAESDPLVIGTFETADGFNYMNNEQKILAKAIARWIAGGCGEEKCADARYL